MSGEHFEFLPYRLEDVSEEIERLIRENENEELDDLGHPKGHFFPPEIIARFAEAAETVRRARIMMHRVDYLVSGDDGEETFLEEWDKQLPFSCTLFALEFKRALDKCKTRKEWIQLAVKTLKDIGI